MRKKEELSRLDDLTGCELSPDELSHSMEINAKALKKNLEAMRKAAKLIDYGPPPPVDKPSSSYQKQQS